MNTIGVIQGLAYGLCAIPDRTTLLDCEVFSGDVIVSVDCTTKRFNELNESLNKLGISCCKASEALNKLCNALYTSPSNNGLKMHGYPMRRRFITR